MRISMVPWGAWLLAVPHEGREEGFMRGAYMVALCEMTDRRGSIEEVKEAVYGGIAWANLVRNFLSGYILL